MENLKSLINRRAKKTIEDLNRIQILDVWKNQLTDALESPTQKHVYLCYPELFWNSFKHQNDNEVLDKLCLAGYFYYCAILLQDKIVDNNKSPLNQYLPFISFLQEETIKILSSIFPYEHEIWNKWNLYREKFSYSLIIDKETDRSLSYSEFKEFAINKSVYAQFAIDCGFYLSENKENNKVIYDRIIKSHEYFSIGFQFLDDFDDISEDFKNKQKNIIIQYCKENITNSGKPENSLDELKRFFYLSGFAETILNDAKESFSKAYLQVKEISGLEIWKTMILDSNKKANYYLTQIQIYLKEVYAKSNFSFKKFDNNRDIHSRIQKALDFICKQQNINGSWSDIITKQGISSVWTTGFVVWNLYPVKDKIENNINHAINYLTNSRSSVLWGYNSNWLFDIDSTTNVIFALSKDKNLSDEDFLMWKHTQKDDGSFSTYPNDEELKQYLGYEFDDFKGWVNSHICVSAFSLYVLSHFNGFNDEREKLLNYLLKNQNSNGMWSTYWWTSSIYSTVFIIKSLIIIDYTKYENQIFHIVDSILKLQNSDYSFGSDIEKESAFFTILVLNTLCSSSILFEKYKTYVEGMYEWLLMNQFDDGSFKDSYILRVPDPKITEPNLIKDWNFKRNSGVNTLSNDVMRLFTTSLAINTFIKYDNLNTSNL